MIFRKAKTFAAGLILAVTPILTLAMPGIAHAAGNTCVWTGSGNGTTFSDATNWTSCGGVAPVAGDTLSFGTTGNSPNNLTNDLGLAFGGVIDTAAGTWTGQNYAIDTLTLASGATIDQTSSVNGSDYTNVTVTNLTAQGALTIKGSGRFSATNWTLNGVLTLTQGAYFNGDSVGSSGVVVEKGSSLYFNANTDNDTTPSYPITLGGGTGTATPYIAFHAHSSTTPTTWAFGNPITLVSDATLMLGEANVTVNQTGSISGPGFALSMDPTSAAGSTLVLAASSNNSGTVLGTFTGTGAGTGTQSGSDGGSDVTAPDTGFALVSAHPVVTLAITLAAAGALIGAAQFGRKASARR